MKRSRERKKYELFQRICFNDTSHVPYFKSSGNPTWFRHPKIKGVYLCGLCNSRINAKPPKFSSKLDLLQSRADFMRKNNPMFKPEAKSKISRIQSGETNSFFQKKHTTTFIEKLRTRMRGNIFWHNAFKNRNKEKTIPQRMLEIIVEELGYEFQADVVSLNGIPDIKINNIILFCDGDYHHANPTEFLSYNGKVKQGYKPDDVIYKKPIKCLAKDKWKHDSEVTKDLLSQGYEVYRFWESDIYHNAETVIKIVRNAVTSSR